MNGPMSCEHAVGLVVDSLVEGLDRKAEEGLRAHLRSCADCATEARAIERTWSELGELAPPDSEPDLEKLLARLPGERRLHPTSSWLAAAAAVALLLVGGAGGFWAGTAISTPAEPSGPAFLLLVRGDEPDRTVPTETLVEEYREWATGLAERGRLLAGEKLADDPGRWVSRGRPDTRTRSDVSGYFVVAATDYDEAVEIATDSPHVRYGGIFEIRRIDRLP